MGELDVRAERRDEAAVLVVAGELDLATAGALHEAVAEQLAAGPVAELVLDLARVSFLDSSGLGALLRIRGEVVAAGGNMRVSALARGPARVIAIAGLSDTLGLADEA